jgi:hypothetical protein
MGSSCGFRATSNAIKREIFIRATTIPGTISCVDEVNNTCGNVLVKGLTIVSVRVVYFHHVRTNVWKAHPSLGETHIGLVAIAGLRIFLVFIVLVGLTLG